MPFVHTFPVGCRYDFQVISELVPDIQDLLRPSMRDGKATAKRSARRVHPQCQFEKRPRGGKYTLDKFLSLAGYPVPQIHGPGNTGQRLTYVLRQLERRGGDYQAVTPSAKTKWSNLLKHNYHDVHGLRDLCVRSAAELAER